MRLPSVGRVPHGLLWILVLSLSNGFCEDRPEIAVVPNAACDASLATPGRAYPVAELGCGAQIAYLGSYSAEGRFVAPSKRDRWHNEELDQTHQFSVRPAEVPPFVNLHSSERVVQSYLPPIHATQPVKGQSRLASFRDNLITFAYGHEKVLLAPHHVVVDSHGRVIVTDPRAGAIHVLDGAKSFRMLTSAKRRVAKANGVAVDGDDNIYVADQERGLVAVFGSDGGFQRYIGKLGHDESLFHFPTGIAIDPVRQHLYVLDSERHLIFELDLQGNILRRIGAFRGNDVVVDLELPTEIAVNGNHLLVLDAGNSRVTVMDLDGKLEHRFDTGLPNNHDFVDRIGFAVDNNDRIYLSNLRDCKVDVFDINGHELTAFGQPGTRSGEFISPTGLWVDGYNKIYVAEEFNHRVQVFQMTSTVSEQLATAPAAVPATGFAEQTGGGRR
jgi:sugar lactone lactonase YvrE